MTRINSNDLTRSVWITRDGRKLHISDMDTNHLYNTAVMIWGTCTGLLPKSRTLTLIFLGMLEELDKRIAEVPLDRLHKLAVIAHKIKTKVGSSFSDRPTVIAALERGFVDTFNQRRTVNPTVKRTDLPALRSTSRAREFRSINLDED